MVSILLALLFSTVLITVLCAQDPKRRRSAGTRGRVQDKGQRRALAAALCLPGLVFALRGDAAAFMMWLGGTAVIGWFVAQVFAAKNSAT